MPHWTYLSGRFVNATARKKPKNQKLYSPNTAICTIVKVLTNTENAFNLSDKNLLKKPKKLCFFAKKGLTFPNHCDIIVLVNATEH